MGKLKLNTLKQAKVRMNWSKYNLYNMWRTFNINMEEGSVYWQKHRAKHVTRNYFGENVREGLWREMYRARMPHVVEMSPEKLAMSDGSEMSLGRGSGIAPENQENATNTYGATHQSEKIPYFHMVYWPMERRLDVAMFRSMFACSPRMAKGFIRHGFVRVNGKKMKLPGYLLNPGDMFSIDPEHVLFACGRKKPGKDELRFVEESDEVEENADESSESKAVNEESSEEGSENADSKAKDSSSVEQSKIDDTSIASKAKESSEEEVQSANDDTSIASEAKESSDDNTKEDEDTESESEISSPKSKEEVEKTPIGLADPTKPYYTPWTPRPYLSAFAYIPRYLEVNHNICHAVYLRHPVARPGVSEIPSPFAYNTMKLAHSWYTGRNKKVKPSFGYNH